MLRLRSWSRPICQPWDARFSVMTVLYLADVKHWVMPSETLAAATAAETDATAPVSVVVRPALLPLLAAAVLLPVVAPEDEPLVANELTPLTAEVVAEAAAPAAEPTALAALETVETTAVFKHPERLAEPISKGKIMDLERSDISTTPMVLAALARVVKIRVRCSRSSQVWELFDRAPLGLSPGRDEICRKFKPSRTGAGRRPCGKPICEGRGIAQGPGVGRRMKRQKPA